MKQIFKSKYFSWFLLAVALICAYQFITRMDIFVSWIKSFLQVVSPFFYGFLIAYVLNIPCVALQRLFGKSKLGFIARKRKVLSILVTYVLVIVLVVLVLRLMVPYVYASLSTFFGNFNDYYKRAEEFAQYINDLDIFGIEISMEEIRASVQSFGIENISMDNITASISAAYSVSSAVFKGFLAAISSIYILMEKQAFKVYFQRMLRSFMRPSVFGFVMGYANQLNRNAKQYIYTQTIDGIILGTIATIELYVLRSPFALVLGIMLGILNYIPYFGSIIGSLVAIAVVALTQGLPTAALAAVILLVTQQIDGNIIQPRLMGGSFKLSPLLIIISITVGGAFFNALGMIAAVPIVAVIKEMLDDIIKHLEKRKADAADIQE